MRTVCHPARFAHEVGRTKADSRAGTAQVRVLTSTIGWLSNTRKTRPKFQPPQGLRGPAYKPVRKAGQRSKDWKMEEIPLGVLGDEVARPSPHSDRGKIFQALREQDRAGSLHAAEHVIRVLGGGELKM